MLTKGIAYDIVLSYIERRKGGVLIDEVGQIGYTARKTGMSYGPENRIDGTMYDVAYHGREIQLHGIIQDEQLVFS